MGQLSQFSWPMHCVVYMCGIMNTTLEFPVRIHNPPFPYIIALPLKVVMLGWVRKLLCKTVIISVICRIFLHLPLGPAAAATSDKSGLFAKIAVILYSNLVKHGFK